MPARLLGHWSALRLSAAGLLILLAPVLSSVTPLAALAVIAAGLIALFVAEGLTMRPSERTRRNITNG